MQWLTSNFGSKEAPRGTPSTARSEATTAKQTTDVCVHESKHAHIIGPKGATVQRLKDSYQVSVEVPKKGSGSHTVVIAGETSKRLQCLRAMEDIVGHPLLPDAPLCSAQVDIPAALHGRLIGKGGANLKALQAKGCTAVVPDAGAGSTAVTFYGYAAVLSEALAASKELVGATNFKVLAGSAEIEDLSAIAAFEPLPLDGKIVEALFFPEPASDQDGPKFKRFLHYLVSASRSLDVCVFTITDNRIARALIAAHHRGVAVRIITDDEQAKTLGSDVEEMKGQGIQVRMDSSPFHMHHKFAIVDNKVLINGSYNWTLAASTNNNENITILSEPALLTAFRAEFDRLWQLFPPR